MPLMLLPLYLWLVLLLDDPHMDMERAAAGYYGSPDPKLVTGKLPMLLPLSLPQLLALLEHNKV